MQLVPQMLRELRPDLRIGFFLHIPFPPAELFQQLPWRRQLLEGLLGADLVGFQLPGGAANFVRLVRQRVGHKTHRDLVYLPDGRIVRDFVRNGLARAATSQHGITLDAVVPWVAPVFRSDA